MSFVGLILLVSSIVGYVRAESFDEIDNIDRILRIDKSVDSELYSGECRLPNLPVDSPGTKEPYVLQESDVVKFSCNGSTGEE